MGQESDWMRGLGTPPFNQPLRTGTLSNTQASKPDATQNENTSTNNTGVALTISKPSLEELNKGIAQAKQDYATAHMRGDQKGMAVAVQTANNLRAIGGTATFSTEPGTSQPARGIVESPADQGTARRDPRDGSVVITSGDDAGEVVILPAKPNVGLQNALIENAKVKHFRAQLLGDTRSMEEASKEAELARAKGGTLRSEDDTPLTRSLKRYAGQVDVIKTGIRTRDTLDLNKGIFQLKNDYLYAKNTNDSVGMEAARIMGDILRKLGGTIGSEVSLEDAKKMIAAKPAPPTSAPTPPPVDIGSKSGEIFDRVLGFVTGAGVEAGKGLLSILRANADPLGAALDGIRGFVSGIRNAYDAASDWDKTVEEINGLLSQFREYYNTAPAYEKGKLEGQFLVDTLAVVFGTRKVTIVNGKLANSFHPVSGVPFDVDGFPIFNPKFEARIDPEFYTAGAKKHREFANAQLKKDILENPSISESFTKVQIDDIKENKTPRGYIWHHHQEVGRMQLVEEWTHEKTGHTGGMAIWGR